MESPFYARAPEHDLLWDYQSGKYMIDHRPSYQQYSPCPPIPSPAMFSSQPPESDSIDPLTSKLTTASLARPTCPQCKGDKYTFTSYFHNTKVFARPPHELLGLIEASYVLKNRLLSLLITYAAQEIDQNYVQAIEIELCNWEADVEALARAVAAHSFGCQQVSIMLKNVQIWTRDMVKQLWEHVCGNQLMEMPRGKSKDLVVQFRKKWEEVWVAYLQDRTVAVDIGCRPEGIQSPRIVNDECMEIAWRRI